jgi:uncharacterized protein (DUF1800 family)
MLVAAGWVLCGGAMGWAQAVASAPAETPATRAQALQILDRFTYGPQPGEVDAVMREGWRAWFEQQLEPQSIPDAEFEARMRQLPALRLTPSELLEELPSAPMVRRIANGKMAYSGDWMTAGLEEVLVMKYREKQQEKGGKQRGGEAADASLQAGMSNGTGMDTNRDGADAVAQANGMARQMLALPAGQRMREIMQLPVAQRALLAEKVAGPVRQQLLAGFAPHEREVFLAMGRGPNAVVVADNELQQAEVLRAILSTRQLQAVMTDFWFNHFNVYFRKGADQWYTPDYVRQVMAPYALGKFPDLLLATAQSPAMLFYLDNWLSVGPDSPAASHARRGQPRPSGINENYGREVMELHTVGVGGGYSQADVIALAKIMTGWTIDQPYRGGEAAYMPQRHEPGSVEWYGHKVRDTGYDEGRDALLWLARQPATAHHISYELAQRFVADTPPPALVDAMAKTYLRTDGDIRQMLWTMVNRPEFWAAQDEHNKVKTPLDFVASAFRATGTNPTQPEVLVQTLARMGEPLYLCLPPTGYEWTAADWMNTGALVERLNFAMQLASDHLGGMKMDPEEMLAEAHAPQVRPAVYERGDDASGEMVSLEEALLGRRASAHTEQVIERQLAEMPHAGETQRLQVMTALLLGSPEFQMR